MNEVFLPLDLKLSKKKCIRMREKRKKKKRKKKDMLFTLKFFMR